MATDPTALRYQGWYTLLLKLYPRTFRERFGEPMVQTFRDLYRERGDAGQGMLIFALPIFYETLVGIVQENIRHMPQSGKTMLRVALGALAVWMVPVIAAQFIPDWHWGVGGFVRVYLFFFIAGMVITLIARRMGVWSYKAGVGLAIVASLALGWSTMVQTADSGHPERLLYLSVLAVGLFGACLARLKAKGLAVTSFAMAAVLALLSVMLRSGAPPDPALRMAIGHGVFVVLFAASGLLFRHASLALQRGRHQDPL